MEYNKPAFTHFHSIVIFLSLFFLSAGCGINDADETTEDLSDLGVTGNSVTYEIESRNISGFFSPSGQVRFEELNDGSTIISVDIGETISGAQHPVHIRNNAAIEGGPIVLNLNPVNGDTGLSETIVSNLDDDTPIQYSSLVTFDGHISIDMGEGEDADVMASGDIGSNKLTGQFESYKLSERNDSGISGSVLFEERNNNNTLVSTELNGTSPERNHPVYIYNNSAEEGGDIFLSIGTVDGQTGIGQSNIRADVQGSGNLTYSILLNFNGHVNVHLNENDFTPAATGNIGSNQEEFPEEDDEDEDENENGSDF